MPAPHRGIQRSTARVTAAVTITKVIKIYHSCDPPGTKLLTRFKCGKYTPFDPAKDPHLQAVPVQVPRARGKTTYERRCCKAKCEICEDTDLFTDLTLSVAQAHGIRNAPLKPGVSASASAAERLEDAEIRGRWMYGHLRPAKEVLSQLLTGPPAFAPNGPWIPDGLANWVMSIPSKVDNSSSRTHISAGNEADAARTTVMYQVPGHQRASELRAGQDREDIADERNARGYDSHQNLESSASETQQPAFRSVGHRQGATLKKAPPNLAAHLLQSRIWYASLSEQSPQAVYQAYAKGRAQQSIYATAPAPVSSVNSTGGQMHQFGNTVHFAPDSTTGINRLAPRGSLPPQRPTASAPARRQALPVRTKRAPFPVIDLTGDDDDDDVGRWTVQKKNLQQDLNPLLLKDAAAFTPRPPTTQKRLREPDHGFNVKRGRYDDKMAVFDQLEG